MTYTCAFCGEDNEVFTDESGGRRQTFTEDCAVCCRPNLITLVFDEDGDVELDVSQEYEAAMGLRTEERLAEATSQVGSVARRQPWSASGAGRPSPRRRSVRAP